MSRPPGEPAAAHPGDHSAWQRLDRRMLLIHPINELVRFIPVLIATLVAGARSDNPVWSLGVLTIIVGFALTRWFTTTYRITPENVELRTGLLQRKRLSVPRARVRSVDVQADLLHRALGLAVLTIGTGSHTDKHEQFRLDSLAADLVPGLRAALLAHASSEPETVAAQPITSTETGAADTSGDTAAPAHRTVEIGHWQPDWVRYAPLSLTGFAFVAPLVGLAFQYGLAQVFIDSDTVHDVGHRSGAVVATVIGLLVVALVLVVSLAACARYLLTYHGLRVTDDGKTLHIRHGLLTTRQTTLDLARLRGATVNEPLLLRLAGAAELEAIMTGTSPRQKILPQAPRAAVHRTLAHLLGDTTGTPPAAVVPLRAHGPAAQRRRYTRALGPLAAAAAVLLMFSLAGVGVPLWMWIVLAVAVPVAAALARDRYRGLGHAVLPAAEGRPAWLITRSGSLDRDRDCLEAPGVIGWTVRQTFFQRRAGVATVIAASAAGKKRYRVLDLPVDQAWALIESITPGRLGSRPPDRPWHANTDTDPAESAPRT